MKKTLFFVGLMLLALPVFATQLEVVGEVLSSYSG